MTMYFVHNKTTPIKQQQQQQRRPDAHLSQWSEQLLRPPTTTTTKMISKLRADYKLERNCCQKEHMTRRRRKLCPNLSPSIASLLLLLVGLAAYVTTLEATHQDGVTRERGGSDARGEEELREDQVHRLMSDQDLRRTFHVDSHDQVPEYQILKLTVQTDGSHLISPISDLGELTGELHNSKRHHLEDDETRKTSNEQLHKRNKRATEDAKLRQQQPQQPQADNKLIVMNLSTFGRDFSLRLKRNADFQQRIKDMKMFLAESTGNGQLRYTEIKSSAQQQQQHKQEPHKRAADSQAADELLQGGASDNKPATSSSSAKTTPAVNSTTTTSNAGDKLTKGQHHQQQADHWNIGATYHDEDNLAALLIDHDRLTGQLQVDGTIGNDFVIKPMPRATIEALRVASKRQSLSPAEPLNRDDLARSSQQNSSSHLHDDDPHDDDEMFLDEDEALELAHLQASVSTESNHTTQQVSNSNVTQPRTLSKAASERKWKKYRKLMAQTQVPKMGASSSSGTSGNERAKRHAQGARMSHHIIFKQRPSSEASSSEHKHSFMLAPGQQSMEEMVRRFPVGESHSSGAHALNKRATQHEDELENGNMIDVAKSRLASADFATPTLTDMEADPMGGQFYLEPGSISGISRAGHSDWSLIAPYALNSSSSLIEVKNFNSTSTAHARYKRHAPLPLRGGRHPRGAPSQRRHKRQAPDVVWPEVLLVVDYDSFLLHGGDSREVKRYFVSFWNGVDLRYKLLVNPHIRISLAGMIVAKDRDATPYLERNRLRSPNADAVDAAGALTDMGKYLYREDRLPTYDLAVVITKLDMCRRRYEGGRCNRGTAGFAYVGGACVVNKRLEKVNSVAIIEDSGGFSGIIVAAHEVGHLLGCVHDGSPPPSYLGGPGATHCPWEDGFIMSDLRHTERGFRWSQCSVEQFKHFLNGETATCLYNYPHESQMLHRLLPGSMLSLDDQCKRDRGTNACFKDARVCAQLFCFDSASGYCVSYRPAAEGSPCGDGHVCRNGKCVGEIENIIPDYTHQTQTVVARGQRAPLVSGGGPPVVAAHPSARLADNGLSASSTSTATSSPDNNKTTGSAGGVPQISSRMDTFAPNVDEYQHHHHQHHHQHSSTTNAAKRRASYASAPPPTTHQLRPSTAKQLARYSNYPTIDLGLSATATTATLSAASSPPRKLAATSTTSGQLAKRSHPATSKRTTNSASVISNAHSPLSTTSQSLNTRRQQSVVAPTTTTTLVQNLPIDNQRLLYQSAGVQQPNEAPLANYDFYRQAYGSANAGSSPTQSAYVAALMAH